MEKPHPDLGDPEANYLASQQLESVTPVAPDHAPGPLDELDLLRYQKLVAQAQAFNLLVENRKYALQVAERQEAGHGVALGKFLDTLGAKYNVDFHVHSIQEDGSIAPIPPR